MITLNGERGFEDVESWEEIMQLPGFTIDLDPEKEELKEIIGRYIFKDKIACGLTACHQPHGRGYIVTTKSGRVTNIGNICGKNHFGVKFDEFSKVFVQALTDHQNRQAIASFLFQLEGYLEEVSRLRGGEKGADWVYLTSRALAERNHGCPDILVSEVGKMIRARDGLIRIPRLATEEEVKEMEVMAGKSLPRPQYVEEQKGNLGGIECLYHEYNIREILVLDVEPKLAKLTDFDVDTATSSELRFWVKWCQELEEKLERVRTAVKAGQVLLTRENLVQLYEVIPDAKELTSFKKWLANMVGK
jgi:hypothetical protein